jgi:hypothetical protein
VVGFHPLPRHIWGLFVTFKTATHCI